MAAKALVPVEALPRHLPLSGPWAPPTGVVDASPEVELATLSVGAAHSRESGERTETHRPERSPSRHGPLL